MQKTTFLLLRSPALNTPSLYYKAKHCSNIPAAFMRGSVPCSLCGILCECQASLKLSRVKHAVGRHMSKMMGVSVIYICKFFSF